MIADSQQQQQQPDAATIRVAVIRSSCLLSAGRCDVIREDLYSIISIYLLFYRSICALQEEMRHAAPGLGFCFSAHPF